MEIKSKTKKNISSFAAFCLLVFLPPLALAGTPDQDPIVASVRNKLARGLIPTIEQLKVGSKWRCLVLLAKKDDFSQTNIIFSFALFDGLIQPINWSDDGERKLPVDRQSFGAFVINSKGLVGHDRPNHYLTNAALMRMTPNGDLVYERSFTSEQAQTCSNCDQFPTPAIYYGNSFATEYAVCPSDQIL